jgi:DNA-3-methyladenine glycosylase
VFPAINEISFLFLFLKPVLYNNPMTDRLAASFYAQDTVQVALELVGKRLVRLDGDRRIAGMITETEAYRGEDDLACHCRAGRTPRTVIMYGPPGKAYVYFVYGMHWLLNFVTEKEGYPGAVLIRAIQPVEGLDLIAKRRNGRPQKQWTDGPAKLCQALGIDGGFNGVNTCKKDARIFVESGTEIPSELIQITPRIGLETVPEPWRSKPWRFVLTDPNLIHPPGM